ncbi:hypothetical protein SKAU_G00290230 [Synaphobranchus kaupii]|uniref:Uncharacterized protein n=1 Tax=Synaphobranchus kaupii TaxID=118154 RepID=A0A9Q1IK37_SYNKA|nr:hypothetical protein SKAU_G00290230 [Synaphobranchus kaupii]
MDGTANSSSRTAIRMDNTTAENKNTEKSSIHTNKTAATTDKTDNFEIKTSNTTGMITISTRKTTLSREDYTKQQVIWNLSLAFDWLPFSVQPMHLQSCTAQTGVHLQEALKIEQLYALSILNGLTVKMG